MLTFKNLITLVFSLFSTVIFAGETPQITQQDLITALKAPKHNIVVLDVRSAQEYENGHIRDAINVSHNTISENLNFLSQYQNKTVVVYCRSGRRAGVAEHILSENGFKDLRHLTGDMNGWLEAKLPIVTGKSAP
jgi:rhodanese-related sulfurtransferase